MDSKKLYFFLGNLAGLAAAGGVIGTNAALSDDPISGIRQPVHYETVVRPMPQAVETALRNAIIGAPCSMVDAQHGSGSCDPAVIDYDVTYRRKRGKTRVVWRFPGHDVRWPQSPMPSGHLSWIQNRIASAYCPAIDARYGAGTCDPTSIDFTIRFIRTGGVGRVKVELDLVTYCTGAKLPVDPSPPELEPL